MTTIDREVTKYPAVQNYIGGRFVASSAADALDVFNPGDGSVLSRVPLSGPTRSTSPCRPRRKPSRLGRDAHQGARPGLLQVQGAPRTRHRRARRADHRGERQDRQRSARRNPEGRRAHRVRLLAPADRARRSARGLARRRMPHRALPGRRRRVDRAVQLPHHGPQLDHPQRDRARQLHDPQAVASWCRSARSGSPSCCARPDFPDGVFQVVHGGKEAVEAICDHTGIAAVSFVGSTQDREDRLPPRHRDAQALPRARRRQEPPHRHARRRRRDDLGQRRRLDERLRRPALHGRVGDGRGERHRRDHRDDGPQGEGDGPRPRHRPGDLAASRRSGSAATSRRRSRRARSCSWTAGTRP